MSKPLSAALPSRAHGYATCAHRKQRRKYTNEPYVEHCENVALILVKHGLRDEEVFAAAMLHDVLEDTEVTEAELRDAFGDRVTQLVLEVTDPVLEGNRAVRKLAAREHLARSSPEGASIKLADLIDNTSSIATHDPNFARVYLQEKEALLEVLRHGNAELWQEAFETLQEAQRGLVHHRLGGGA